MRQILHFESLESTNTFAKEQKLPGGTVVVADMQTAGRGRMGHSFHSPEGGIYFSYVMEGLTEEEGSKLTVKAAVCICKALEKRGFAPKIKPVNDIFVGGLKVCGILCEYKEGRYIVGIGINQSVEGFPKELEGIAGGLGKLNGEELISDILDLLDEKNEPELIEEEYTGRLR